jgi:hypothetical protein
VAAAARAALETAVGLGVMGLLRLRTEAPRLEAELARRGWEPLAAATHSAADAVDGVIRLLLQPPPLLPPPDTGSLPADPAEPTPDSAADAGPDR